MNENQKVKQMKKEIVTTTIPKPAKKKETFISTHELDADGKSKEQRYYDKQKTIPRPILTTGDIALSESEEAAKKSREVTEEIKREKEKKDEKE